MTNEELQAEVDSLKDRIEELELQRDSLALDRDNLRDKLREILGIVEDI